MNHRKKTKADGSRLIPRKHTETLVLLSIFLSIRSFEQLALALKFFTVLKYFLSFRNFEQLALALKTEFALKFFKPWAAAALPASYVNACYCLKIMGLAFKYVVEINSTP